MNSNINDRKETSNEILYNTRTQTNLNKKKKRIKNSQEINQNPEKQNSNKLLLFIKNKPCCFALVVIGIVILLGIAITLPIVLIKKKNKNDDTDIIMENDILPSLENIFAFSNINSNINSVPKSEIKSSIIEKNGVIEAYYSINSTEYNSIAELCENLTSLEIDNEVKVYIIYKWIAENIEYDYDNYKGNKGNIKYQPEEVLQCKKTVCSGYARLFTELLKCIGYIENENVTNIIGHSKGLGYNVEAAITDKDSDHEWNAVMIGNNWCLIDVTWGAGSIVNEQFQPSYTDYYFCTPPHEFIRTHLPRENQSYYQLLNDTINITTFKNMAKTTPYFFEYGFIGLANDKAIQHFCGLGKIILIYNETLASPFLLTKIKRGNIEYKTWIMDKKIENGYEIDFYINEKGEYDLEVYAKNDSCNITPYNNIVSFKIKCTSSPPKKKYFPLFTFDYKIRDNIELISPIDNLLVQGQNYNFSINNSISEQLYLLIGKSSSFEIIKMDEENSISVEDNVMIHGEFVKISYKSGDHFYPLVEYNTSGKNIEFPQCSETPFKKRLESPLKEELKVGETYNFRIISNTSYIFTIYYNDTFYDLNKIGIISSGTIKILTNISDLMVMYNASNTNYTSMYIYKIS